MGRGSYLGGSTIIGPHTNWSDRDGIPVKTKTKKKPQRTLKQTKLDFLNLVIDSELNGERITSIPSKSKATLTKLVNEKGGIEKWAKAQPQHKELKAEKLKKRKKKESKSQSVNFPNDNLSLSITALEKRINENRDAINGAKRQIEEDESLIQHIIGESKKEYE